MDLSDAIKYIEKLANEHTTIFGKGLSTTQYLEVVHFLY